MNIIVCIKRVPSTETNVRIASDGKSLDASGVEYVLSPYDEMALEEGLRVKEKAGAGEVIVVTLGPSEAATTLRTCLAMGADKAILLKDDQPRRYVGVHRAYERDPFAVATALATAIKEIPFDIIFLGKQAVDDDNSQVGAMVARLLNLPLVSLIVKLEIADPPDGEAGKKVILHREIEGGHEVIEASLPAVFTAQRGLNEPRYPSLKGIMGAKKKPLEEKTPQLLSPTLEVVKMEYPPSRPPGRIVGQGVEAVPELVRLLREEAKVI